MLVLKIRLQDSLSQKLELLELDKLSEKITGQCVFMFTNMSPFRLNVLLGKEQSHVICKRWRYCKYGCCNSTKEYTGIAPGPMLTDFKENGIATKIDQGTIWIMKETIPVKKGEAISEKLAGLLSKLDIKAIEAGIILNAALEEGSSLSTRRDDYRC